MVESDTCLPVGTKSYKISNIPDINGQYILEQWQFDSCDWRVSIPISTVYYTFSGSGCAFLANTISLTTLWIVVGVSGEFGTKFIWGSIRVGDWDEMGIHAFYNQRPQLDPCQFGTLTNEYTIVPQHSIISHGGIMTVEALL